MKIIRYEKKRVNFTKGGLEASNYRITFRKDENGIKQPVVWRRYFTFDCPEKWRIVKQTPNKDGSFRIYIWGVAYQISHLVLIWKKFPNGLPKDGGKVYHINHNRWDNSIENLKWVSPKRGKKKGKKKYETKRG